MKEKRGKEKKIKMEVVLVGFHERHNDVAENGALLDLLGIVGVDCEEEMQLLCEDIGQLEVRD